MVTLASGVNPNKWLTLNSHPLRFATDEVNLACAALEYKDNVFQITQEAPKGIRIKIEGKQLSTRQYGYWLWKPRSYAGLYSVEVTAENQPVYITTVRVQPSKLSFERYKLMLAQVSQIAQDLLIQSVAPASEKATTIWHKEGETYSALNQYNLVSAIIYELESVMNLILRSPRHKLASTSQIQTIHKMKRFSNDVQPLRNSYIQLKVGNSYTEEKILPQNWSEPQFIQSYDTYENQLLKHFLRQQLIPKLTIIENLIKLEIERRRQFADSLLPSDWKDQEYLELQKIEEVEAYCKQLKNKCQKWGNELFLREVKSPHVISQPTQVLQKNPAYSHFYRLYLRFQQKLRLNLETEAFVTKLSLRKIAEIYEIWSVFYLTRYLIEMLQSHDYLFAASAKFYTVEEDRFQFQVRKNKVAVQLERDKTRVKFIYEPVYPARNSVQRGVVSRGDLGRRPDLVLEVWINGKIQSIIIFDAKYRYEERNGEKIYLQNDLDKMNRYLSEIRLKAANSNHLANIVGSAYILYPGSVSFHDEVEIDYGAIPLVPKMSPEEEQRLDQIIQDILEKAELL